MTDPIERVFIAECEGVAEALLSQAAGVESRIPRDQLLARSGYSVGVEIGLAVAIADIAAARRLQSWFAHRVQEGDPEALAARDRQARHYLEVLR